MITSFIYMCVDKTIKLWRVSESHMYSPTAVDTYNTSGRLKLPVRESSSTLATMKRLYENAHTYNINSISLNSDCEHFISCDDLRVNLWHLDSASTCFNLVDIKPHKMEDLTEVITAARFHPQHCHTLAYSTSKYVMSMCIHMCMCIYVFIIYQ